MLALFPLPVVLFPGAVQGLHIFEPRYRKMLSDCLSGDLEFGVLYLPPGVPEDELGECVGCRARVTSSQQLSDGRSNIVVRGTTRFRFSGYSPGDAPYRVGLVEDVRDEAGESPSMQDVARAQALFKRAAVASLALRNEEGAAPELPDSPDQVAWAIAEHLELPAVERQQLLASTSGTDRLRRVESILSANVDALESRAATHARARTNGHGPHPE